MWSCDFINNNCIRLTATRESVERLQSPLNITSLCLAFSQIPYIETSAKDPPLNVDLAFHEVIRVIRSVFVWLVQPYLFVVV